MEQDFGSESNPPPVSIDKSKVLEIRPLRCLVPIFPNPPATSSLSTPQPSPFVCVPPSGPFPSGVHPFYPFLVPNDSQNTTFSTPNRTGNYGFRSNIPPAPVPLNSFRTNSVKSSPFVSGFSMHVADAGAPSTSMKRTGRAKRRKSENGDGFDTDSLVNTFLTSFNLNGYDELRRASGDHETAKTVLLIFDLLQRKLTQLEETIGSNSILGLTKRADLKASNLLMSKGIRTNGSKRAGHVPGVEVGDIFFCRMELCLVGLHAQTMAGIDYMTVKYASDEVPVAVSIVSSGVYDDQEDDVDVLIYSGHGGVQRRDGQMFDQKLEKGNLALENSLHRGNDVRVVRGIKDISGSRGSKIYVYDGVYKIQESWVEKNQSGCSVFKYKMRRGPGQPEVYSLWKSIGRWKAGSGTRTGFLVPDLSSGAEAQPVSLVNEVDGEKGFSSFTYISRLICYQPFSGSGPSSEGCKCKSGCQSGDVNCPCAVKNGGFLPYTSNGVLLTDKLVIHECGDTCVCSSSCRNRISQVGLRSRFEVFKTSNRGWGLRSWGPVRAGGFICEYAGDVVANNSYNNGKDDDYIFDTTRYYEPLEPARVDDSNGSTKSPFPVVISAKNNGNVARFMNHSCSPNVFWLPILRESNGDSFLHIGFFAIRHIPPMQELTYDYGMVSPEKRDKGKKKCLCGSMKCKGYFY